jgi:ubiquitin-like protein Pup
MPSTERKQERKKKVSETEEVQQNNGLNAKSEEIKEDLDKILDEIDEILEEDSEEFVENYIQRGGQ